MEMVKVFTVISGIALIVIMSTGWDLWKEALTSMGYFVFFGFVYGTLWSIVARGGFIFLHQFYIVMSVLRMVALIAIIIIYQLLVHNTLALRNFAIIIFIYYIVLLVFTSRFFSNVERKKRI